jgi:hypothetical protein
LIKSIAFESDWQATRMVEKSVLQLSITPLHDTTCPLEDEAFLLSFTNRTSLSTTIFNLLPAGRAELVQLALYLGTCSYFHTTVTHEIVPGQHITSVPNSGGDVAITLSTETDLVELLGDPGIVKSLRLDLNIAQLEAYEEFITRSIDPNVSAHSLNMGSLDSSKQLQFAS